MNKELEEAEEAIEYFKKFTEYTKNRAIEEYKCENRNIQYAKDLEKRARIFETVLKHIDNSISKEVIKEKIEEVRKMKFEDERLNGATIDFAACKFEEILEGK